MGFQIENGILIKYTEESGVTDVVIPQGVTCIGNRAFRDCEHLTSITIPQGVVSIVDWAFHLCGGLVSVTIPEGVTYIGDYAFNECQSLTGIPIPKSVTRIGDGAFNGCGSLANITIPQGVTDIGGGAFNGCGSLTSITVPEGVTSIGSGLFNWCKKLASVALPEGVRCIGDSAFNMCLNLTSITIPKSVTCIGDGAFNDCGSLTHVTIPEGVVSIGGGAFGRCGRLADITIPGSVASIGSKAFIQCKQLTVVTLMKGVTHIGKGAFQECANLTCAALPEGISSISDSLFYQCESLASVTIPEGVTHIGKEAFSGCKGLTSITIPDSVTGIQERAFAGCGISMLSLPKALLGQINYRTEPDISFGLVLRDGGKRSFLAYSAKKSSDNLKDFFTAGTYQQYDLELLGNGPAYRYKLPARLLGMLGRLECPVGLTEDIRAAFGELLRKNAKKLLLLAEELRCPEIVQALLRSGAVDVKTEKAIRKLLAESPVPEIAALAERRAEGESKAVPKPGREKTLSEGEALVARLLREEGRTPADAVKTLEQFYSVKPILSSYLPEVSCKDGSPADASVLTYLLTAHETLQEYWKSQPDVIAAYEAPGVCPHAAEVLALLDQESLQAGLLFLADRYLGRSERTKQMFLAFPICRYADEATMRELTKRAPQWASKRSKDEAPHLRTFRAAALYSETRSAMLFAEKYHELDEYAAIHGTTADAVRDQYLSDIGLDERGGRQYDLGNQTVTARLQPDLSFLVGLPDGKTAKSLPQKGADPEKYQAAKEDLDLRRKDAKRVIRNRSKVLFEDFLSGRERASEDWQGAYLHNPLLRSVAKLLVWSQDKSTFTLTDSGAIRSDGQAYQLGAGGIRVAHPMEMTPGDVAAWQEYFRANHLKQPFEQIWEPAYDPETVKPDRYDGCVILCDWVRNAKKHGIHYGYTGFGLDDCNLDNWISDPNWNYVVAEDTTFTLGRLTVQEYTRRVNHIVYLFDKWTIWERIQKDDIDIVKLLDLYNAAQITEFLNIAIESEATNLTAALLEYKHTHFPAYDAFAEFTLD